MTAYVKPILPVTAQFAVPELATKFLKFKTVGGKRKIVISSNWLPLFNFNGGDDMATRSLGSGAGLVIELVTDLFNPPKKTKKVYERTYPKRKNSPLETLIELASQKDINESFLFNAEGFHVKFEANRLTVTPVTAFKEQVLANAKYDNRYSIFAACSSGVDLHLMEKHHGFNCHSLIEHRPWEKRDKRDLTETGALSALRNIKSIKNLFNEDITYISTSMIEKVVKDDPPMIFMASPQCDEYTPVKSKKLKEEHVEDLSSSLDMSLDMIRVGQCVRAPVIKFEQVQGWYKSDAYKILSLRFRKLGYKEHLLISNAAEDYSGLTNRTRGYSVFTMLDVPFEFETPTGPRKEPLWPVIEKHLPECRDVTHSKSLQDGKRIGRLRTITPESTKSPTLLKSQSRMAKDSLVIELEDKLIWPSEPLVKELMGVPDYNTDCVSSDIAFEIIGQSVDAMLHNSVASAVKKHIDLYFDSKKVIH